MNGGTDALQTESAIAPRTGISDPQLGGFAFGCFDDLGDFTKREGFDVVRFDVARRFNARSCIFARPLARQAKTAKLAQQLYKRAFTKRVVDAGVESERWVFL